ncbi:MULTISPECIES: protein-arginine deiminase domain-containing protein [unclassified Streptomyces]|uniref:protein-arginine deiminase domain-containing protein n=1 Tax=Streptomyces sp. ST1020 TaxID=1848901 RepID=UPI00223BD6CF|nr:MULTISPECIES: protein-arginine deiminase domain-containing protein [unclassified Streptomyces]
MLAVPAAVGAERVPQADLRADVNRDGRVDVTGSGDTAGEDNWSVARGALFLPNLDDDSRRCPRTGTDAQLAACNDASDTRVNGAADAADLARLRTVPLPNAKPNTTGRLALTTGAKHTHLFLKRGGTWTLVTPRTRLTAAELRTGVELGVEATDIIRDKATWDGRAVIRLTVTTPKGSTTDSVTLRVAPLLTHHHLQNAQQVMVTKMSGDEDDLYGQEQAKFVKNLAGEVKRAGITAPLITFTKYNDPWAQDFVEPAYVSMTGPGGKRQAMRVMLRSPQPDRDAGRELFEKLRGRDIGAVQLANPDQPKDWSLNSFGNLETIPPYTHNGRAYPAGRIIMGERKDNGARPSQKMRTLLASQGLQDPLLLDTSWLGVGHVDEFVQFLPADTPRGWRIGLADPDGGLRLLRDAQRAGHGTTKVFSVPAKSGAQAPKATIDQALASRDLLADNQQAARRIAANLTILKRETGITDAEVVRVPALYQREYQPTGLRAPRLTRVGPDLAERLQEHGQHQWLTSAKAAGTVMTSAYVPGAVNGVVLSRTRYLAPRQWGPVIGGKDIFTEAVTAAYRGAGMTVSYIDDYYTYHLGMGEVHCGTNTLRDISAAWWARP